MATCGSDEEANRIASLLVSAHLAACVNIIPVKSVFEWKGIVQDQPEWLLIIKSVRSNFDAIKENVTANHSYELPEIVAVDMTAASGEYANWIRNVCGIE
jgi:periplasmic divalent cation tolerance protein